MASFCVFRPGGPCPVNLSVSVQSAQPPFPVVLIWRGSRLPGGGSYVSHVSCVCHVFPSSVHIWFVSCPRLMLLLVKYVPAVSYYVSDYPVHLSSCLFSSCCLVYSLLPVFLSVSALPCLILKTVNLSLSLSRVPHSSPLCAPWHIRSGEPSSVSGSFLRRTQRAEFVFRRVRLHVMRSGSVPQSVWSQTNFGEGLMIDHHAFI